MNIVITSWASLGLILLVCEVFVPGVFLVFFGLGALVVAALLLACPFLSIAWQWIIFSVVSLLLLLILRKRLAKTFVGRTIVSKEDLDDEFTGHTATATTGIAPDKPGKIELNGTMWNAVADETIAAGDAVTVVSREGLNLRVRRG